jgi:hypothetical protein
VALTEGLAVERSSEHKQMLARQRPEDSPAPKADQAAHHQNHSTTERTAFQEKMQQERDEFEQIYNTT